MGCWMRVAADLCPLQTVLLFSMRRGVSHGWLGVVWVSIGNEEGRTWLKEEGVDMAYDALKVERLWLSLYAYDDVVFVSLYNSFTHT